MSTVISEKISAIIEAGFCRMRSVDIQESLGDFVRRIMDEKNLTLELVQRNSTNRIDGAYVHDILKGKSKNPSILKLIALADGLGEPKELLFAKAGGYSITNEEINDLRLRDVLIRYKNLNPEIKEFLKPSLEFLTNLFRAYSGKQPPGKGKTSDTHVKQLDVKANREGGSNKDKKSA